MPYQRSSICTPPTGRFTCFSNTSPPKVISWKLPRKFLPTFPNNIINVGHLPTWATFPRDFSRRPDYPSDAPPEFIPPILCELAEATPFDSFTTRSIAGNMNQSDYAQVPAVPPPEGQTSNFVNPPSQETSMIAVSAVMMALTLAFVSLRLYTSFRVTRKPGLEDWLCVVALVFSFGHICGVLLLSHKSRHMWDVPMSWFMDDYWKIRLFANLFQSFAYFSSRLPVLMLYLRLFGETRGFRISCYICLALVFSVSLVAIPLLSYYCAPFPSEGWHSLAVFARCKNILNWAIIQGGLDIFLDLYVFILPLPIVLSLHMPKRQKLGVLAVFLTGFLAVLASVVGFYFRYRLTYTNDVNWNEGIYICTIIVEINIATICSCMPACYALLRHMHEKRSSSSSVRHILQPQHPNASSTFLRKQDSSTWLPELSHVELHDIKSCDQSIESRNAEYEQFYNGAAPSAPGDYHVP